MKLALLERRLFIEQAALQRNLAPIIMEKDLWLCWLLGLLFDSEFSDSLVFKSGTTSMRSSRH